MKINTIIRNIFSLNLIFLLSLSAFSGERVIVIMKDQQSFRAAHQAYRSKGAFAFRSLGLKSKSGIPQIDGKIESTLENLNALIVTAKDDAEIAKLGQDPSIAYVEKEIFHQAPRPVSGWLSTPAPSHINLSVMSASENQGLGLKTPWGIAAVKAPQAWGASNHGEGARVLVLDTGIDLRQPSLKVNFEQGRDFTEEGGGDGSDFSDTIGHGTHVSGTIAAAMTEGGFTGVAPQAKLLMGRVCSGRGCSNVAVAEGINWGISNKVDVISMSLGGSVSTPAEKDAVAKAIRAGVTVVAASGNDGSNKVSYPAALQDVIAVGAVDENSKRAAFSQYGDELTIVAPGVNVISTVPLGTGREALVNIMVGDSVETVNSATFQGAREVLNGETNVLIDVGFGKTEDFSKKDLKGKFALVSRGENSFSEKVKNAITAGATGVVVYNNAPGLAQGALTADGSTLPIAVFMIEREMGQKLVQSLNSGIEVKANLKTLAVDFASYQGTSMATPHLAGVVALIKAANKSLKPKQVRDILIKTAIKLGPNLNNEYGAGLVDAEAAVKAAIDAR